VDAPASSPIELEVEFELQGKHIRRAFVVSAKHSAAFHRAVYVCWIILGGLAAICLIIVGQFVEPRNLGWLGLMFLVMAVVLPFTLPRLLLVFSRDPRLAADVPVQRMQIAVTRNELIFTSAGTRKAMPLHNAILRRYRDLLSICFPDVSFVVVPRNADFGRESFETFSDSLRSLIDQAKLLNAGRPSRP
jgi:hypothetical protein